MSQGTGAPADIKRFEIVSTCAYPDLFVAMEPFGEFAAPEVKMTTVMTVLTGWFKTPESYMMSSACALVVVGWNLKGDIVFAVEEIKVAHRSVRVG